ncbi:MAG TPA: acyl carrier protein [Vicinamibacterales bacterium]
MMQSTLNVVRQLAADILKRPIDEVPVTATRESVPGWDSMAHLNLVLAVEQHFDVQFLPDEMLQMLTVELVAMLVEEKLAARG